MKEYKVIAFSVNGKWFYRLTDAETWNSIILTESQFAKCINKGIRTF